jgi:hypothetical protein
MPFISSVSGSLGGLIWPLSKASAPTVTISSTTNFNQSIATFNGTVSANGAVTTTIKFQISSDNGTTWNDATGGTTISNTSSQSVSVYYNATGLSEGTVYKVRITATNSVGTSTTTATTGDFTTWSKQLYERTTSGGTTFTIPTVTPTGGSAVAVSIYDIIMFGGGGGGSWGGHGGGGGASQDSASRSLTGSRSITTSVGAGGAGGTLNGDGTTNTGGAGGNTTISGDITTFTANGGGGADQMAARAASSGNGNLGGLSQTSDDGDPKTLDNTAYGGGGGAGGAGANGTATVSVSTGGNGGTGVSITRDGVTRAGGAGGGGAAYVGLSPGTNGSQGTNNTYGSGGNSTTSTAGSAGQAGYIRFRYYASSALA